MWTGNQIPKPNKNVQDLPEGYHLTELGPLPQEWRVVRLGEVVRLCKGRKPPELLKNYEKGAFPYLTADYFRNRIAKEWIPSVQAQNLSFCKSHDIVLIWDGSNAGQVFSGLDGY